MERFKVFDVDCTKLKPGLYVSRKDYLSSVTNVSNVITTFDIRMCTPNSEPAMHPAAVHTIEHVGRFLLSNHPMLGSDTIYFGPKGCRTGFNLILQGDYNSSDIIGDVEWMFKRITNWTDTIPGEDPSMCGNWHDMNIGLAKYYSKKYLYEVMRNQRDRLEYPK